MRHDPDLTPFDILVLSAVCSLKRPTVRSVAALIGSSPSLAYSRLRLLRRLELVAWEDGRHATMHPVIRGEVS